MQEFIRENKSEESFTVGRTLDGLVSITARRGTCFRLLDNASGSHVLPKWYETENCSMCQSEQSFPFSRPPMAQLPSARIIRKNHSKTLGATSLARSSSKGCVCLYTCLTTREIARTGRKLVDRSVPQQLRSNHCLKWCLKHHPNGLWQQLQSMPESD